MQDIKVTGVCLARSFASSNKYATVGDVGEYLEGMLNRSPAGVVLVGKICKPDGTRTVAGCASISFDPSTR